jgi:UDPglucose 6-dehydrogenase
LVEATVDVNDGRKAALADRVAAALGGPVAGKAVAVLGLAFKPETDDMRDAPALALVPKLVERGAAVRAFDPAAAANARPLLPPAVEYADGALEAVRGADALVLMTEWNEFRALDPKRLRAAMRGDVVVDLRNVWEPAAMRAAGFRYTSIGRP